MTGDSTLFASNEHPNPRVSQLCQDIREDIQCVLEARAWHFVFEQDEQGRLAHGLQGIASMLKAVLLSMPRPLIRGYAYQLFHDKVIWDEGWAGNVSHLSRDPQVILCNKILDHVDNETLLVVLLCLKILSELARKTGNEDNEMLRLSQMFQPALMSTNDQSEEAGTTQEDTKIVHFLLRHIDGIVEIPLYFVREVDSKHRTPSAYYEAVNAFRNQGFSNVHALKDGNQLENHGKPLQISDPLQPAPLYPQWI